MRVMQADCQVEYTGRGKTTSVRGRRLIIFKGDGTVIIHRDKGINAMNYMGAVPKVELDEYVDDEGYDHILASSRNETIDITLYHVLYDMELEFDEEVGDALDRVGTERQLQEWLSRDEPFERMFGTDSRFVVREYPTSKGSVDLLGMDTGDEQIELIEVKRSAKRSDVFQVVRYREAMRMAYREAVLRGDSMIRPASATSDAPDIPTESAEEPHCYLVTEKRRPGVEEECRQQNVTYVVTGTAWRKEETDNVSARRVAGNRR